MDWTFLVVKNLVKLVLWLVVLLTMRGAIHSADSVVRLTLTRRIPLVAGPSTVIVALLKASRPSRYVSVINDNHYCD